MTRDPSTRTGTDQHEAWAELAAGHALKTLEPGDEQAFLAHLAACALCQRELVEHRHTLAHLAASADAGEPPAELLAAIRAAVEDDVPARGLPVSWAAAPGEVVVPVASLDARRRRRPTAGAVRWGISLTAAAASVVLVSSLAVANDHLQQQRQAQARSSEQLEDAVLALTSSSTQQVQLSSVRETAESAVAVVDGQQAALVVSGFHPNDAHHVYVLWETVDARSAHPSRVALKGFDVKQPTGVATIKGIALAAGSTSASVLQVTEEAGRTAPAAPAGAPLLSANFSLRPGTSSGADS